MVVGVQKGGQKNIYFIAMNKFKHFKQLYQDNKFDVLLKEKESIYWLKLRSISRKELMLEFCLFANLKCTNIKGTGLFEFIYNQRPSEKILDKFIEQKYKIERAKRKSGETKLVSELYKMKVFDWGGLYQNNLERTIVDNYVKKIRDFSVLNKKIENEIHKSMRGYVQCSWYNHWTSILIEDIFKDHKKVTPTVGLIKKIDFFIQNIPFDLKVTYFPDGFMLTKRKAIGLPTEIQELKKFAKEIRIKYNREQNDKAIFAELLTRISENTSQKAKKFLNKFRNKRWSIIQKAIKDRQNIIRWLYEEQGERRFDAANRLFLVLIDKNNLEESWKMKRNTGLLNDAINDYLDSFKGDLSKLQTKFTWKDGKIYTVLSDVLFIIKK